MVSFRRLGSHSFSWGLSEEPTRISGLVLGQLTAAGAYPSGAWGVARSSKVTN